MIYLQKIIFFVFVFCLYSCSGDDSNTSNTTEKEPVEEINIPKPKEEEPKEEETENDKPVEEEPTIEEPKLQTEFIPIAFEDLHPKVKKAIADSEGKTYNPMHPAYTDSYSANNLCWCDTTYDHDLGDKAIIWVNLNGKRWGVKEICDELKKHPQYREFKTGDIPFNDIQCGNGPANTAADESGCPGRTNIGNKGCNEKGPNWDVEWLSGRERFQ